MIHARIISNFEKICPSTGRQISGWEVIYRLLMTEVFLLPLSCIFLFITIFVNEYTKHYHINFRRLISSYLICLIIENVAHFVQLCYFYSHTEDQHVSTHTMYIMTSDIRLVAMFSALFVNAGIVVERIFATIFIADYEKKTRTYIHVCIVAFVLGLALLFSYAYVEGMSCIIVFTSYTILNVASIVVNKKIFNINVVYYEKSINHVNYSLQYRYQISENVKATKLWKQVERVIVASNTVCLIFLAADIHQVHGFWKNISETVLNYSILLYNTAVPLIIFKHSNPWRKVFNCHKVIPLPGSQPGLQVPRLGPEISIVDTLGRQIKTRERSEEFHDRMRQQWETDGPSVVGSDRF